ncbi:unnamed protein product [Ascophyllum nodosum]
MISCDTPQLYQELRNSAHMARFSLYLVLGLYGCQIYMISAFYIGLRIWGPTSTPSSKTQTLQLRQRKRLFINRLRTHPVASRPLRESFLKAQPAIEAETEVLGGGPVTSERNEFWEEQFERWASKAGITAPKLRHSVFKDTVFGDLRGLKAVQATSKMEQLVAVPRKASITLTGSESTPFKSWVSSDFWDSQSWYVKLALKLLWERQLGTASAVKGYVDFLPAQGSFDTLVHWTDQELDLLNYPKCSDSAKRQRVAWDNLYQNLVTSCPEGAGRTVTKDDLVWAMECVLSRAFKGRFGGGQNSVFISGGILASACAAYAVTEEAIWVILAALALLPLTLPELGSLGGAELFTGTKDVAKDYVLVPYVDSMNHATSATTDLSFSPLTSDLSVAVDRSFPAGEQAYISYGRKTNDELLQFYGFVEADCPADTFLVAGDIAAKMGCSDGKTRDVKDVDVRGGLDDLVICRGNEVVSKETLERLRALLLDSGAGEGDGVVWEALLRVCKAELESVQPSAADGDDGDGVNTVREKLALKFRMEKTSVLQEAIRNLSGRL